MARRKQLEAPSVEKLKEIEEGFARETSRLGSRIPIADVAGDAARHADPLPQHLREEQARDKADARLLREAREKGLVVLEIPLEDIRGDALTRDRMELDEEDLAELRRSILDHGVRLPIEVFEPTNPEDAGKFALISGFRRLAAMRELQELSGGARFNTIPAFVREPGSLANAIRAMIEENEIRTGLSQYERGRVAAIAVHDGVFGTVDEAVAELYAAASKAKRSKIRSFALVHEELGDMLRFGAQLNERQCLRIATGLRAGQGEPMRDALEEHRVSSAADEWAVLEPLIVAVEEGERDRTRGGRPRKAVTRSAPVQLANEVTMEKVKTEDGYAIRLRGPHVNDEMVELVMDRIKFLLEEI
ncbi:Nucleoid occlusion protein (plasmid) [Sulfitobacter sp. THAF37]|uniref:ParB/RepB/Spo0J family partition protein n=1 Tax=Sulfitobacter sp. THAF37 TaxID=2587855 RepID=UPI001268329B|nr:ParB/RepB/Spo0J family partition protein [Sulfitobacter sp. THAF37]QFT60809.1 Nucleoid occlusion protein [Sulfitobacter sp. THAF37]